MYHLGRYIFFDSLRRLVLLECGLLSKLMEIQIKDQVSQIREKCRKALHMQIEAWFEAVKSCVGIKLWSGPKCSKDHKPSLLTEITVNKQPCRSDVVKTGSVATTVKDTRSIKAGAKDGANYSRRETNLSGCKTADSSMNRSDSRISCVEQTAEGGEAEGWEQELKAQIQNEQKLES